MKRHPVNFESCSPVVHFLSVPKLSRGTIQAAPYIQVDVVRSSWHVTPPPRSHYEAAPRSQCRPSSAACTKDPHGHSGVNGPTRSGCWDKQRVLIELDVSSSNAEHGTCHRALRWKSHWRLRRVLRGRSVAVPSSPNEFGKAVRCQHAVVYSQESKVFVHPGRPLTPPVVQCFATAKVAKDLHELATLAQHFALAKLEHLKLMTREHFKLLGMFFVASVNPSEDSDRLYCVPGWVQALQPSVLPSCSSHCLGGHVFGISQKKVLGSALVSSEETGIRETSGGLHLMIWEKYLCLPVFFSISTSIRFCQISLHQQFPHVHHKISLVHFQSTISGQTTAIPKHELSGFWWGFDSLAFNHQFVGNSFSGFTCSKKPMDALMASSFIA